MSGDSASVETQLAVIAAGVASITITLNRLELDMQAHSQFKMLMVEFKAKTDGLNIEQRLNSHATRINELEKEKDQRDGAKWMIGLICTAAGMLGAGGIAIVLRALGV